MVASDREDRRVRSLLLTVLVAATTIGCVPVGPGQFGPAPGGAGPVLVTQVVNRTDHDVTVSYEFESADRGSGGSGEALVSACTVTTEWWSEITGTYTVGIDGELVHSGRIEPGQGAGGHLVVRIELRPGDDPDVAAPVLLAAGPESGFRTLAGCE